MLDEEGWRELQEFHNRADAERKRVELKAKEEGLTLAQIQELNERRTAKFVKEGRALHAKLGLASPFEVLAETPGEMIPEVDPSKLKAEWKKGPGATGFRAAQPFFGPPDVFWAVRFRCTQLALLIENIDFTDLPPGSPDFSVLKKDGQVTDTTIRVLARFPMRKPILGVNPSMPYDLEALVEEVRKRESGQG